MNKALFYAAGNTPALRYACRALSQSGLNIADAPSAEVTHLLLPVPSFESDGRIRGGGILEHILADLPEDITVIGGNLAHPLLSSYQRMDLLQDGLYLAKNAAITADCAMRVAGRYMDTVFDGCPILIIGWGRIGKCLARLLKVMGTKVTVAARKAADRDVLRALGYGAEDPAAITHALAGYRVIFNTVPTMVLDDKKRSYCAANTILIELASTPGIAGKEVISAPGLPGKMAPESSGQLIARTVIRLLAEKEALV